MALVRPGYSETQHLILISIFFSKSFEQRSKDMQDKNASQLAIMILEVTPSNETS